MEDETPLANAPPPASRSADALRELQQRARHMISAKRQRMGQLEAQLTEQLDSIAEALAEQVTERDEQYGHLANAEVEQLRREFDEAQAAWDAERKQLQAAAADRDELAEKLALVADESQSSHDQLGNELADARLRLQEEQAARSEERAALEAAQLAAESQRDEFTAALQAKDAQLAAARDAAEADGDGDQLQQKFDLALEDVQRLRGRVAELEQELTSRPAADQTDSVELVHLRAERDALAEQVAELEQRPAVPADADSTQAQEVADLQRRFELAVEDVRDLKKQNSRLEAQIAEAKSRPSVATPVAPIGGSWESLKQQLLASLEGEADDGDETRREERATVEDTIRITDEVVQSKDREIAELRSQLAEGADSAENVAVRELIDADVVIQQHRERIAKVEREIEEKLRAAELELSVERAKIAREQAQLGDLRAELDSRQETGEAARNEPGGQASKRRWLSKLGLSGDEDGK